MAREKRHLIPQILRRNDKLDAEEKLALMKATIYPNRSLHEVLPKLFRQLFKYDASRSAPYEMLRPTMEAARTSIITLLQSIIES